MYSKPRLKFVSFILFVFIVYCCIVLALLCIVHILCFVKQYDVTRHLSLTSNLLTKITQRKFRVHVICIWRLVYVQILISPTPTGKSDIGL